MGLVNAGRRHNQDDPFEPFEEEFEEAEEEDLVEWESMDDDDYDERYGY